MYIDYKSYYDLYDTKIKVMGDLVEVFEYSDPIKVLKDGKSEPFKKRKSYEKSEKGSGEISSEDDTGRGPCLVCARRQISHAGDSRMAS